MGRMRWPEGFEWIIVDDGSKPPLDASDIDYMPVKYVYKPRPEGNRDWSAGAAFNLGVKNSEADYVLIFPVDHMLTQKVIDFIEKYNKDDVVGFARINGALDSNGKLLSFDHMFKPPAGVRLWKRTRWNLLKGFSEKVVGDFPPHDDWDINFRYKIEFGEQYPVIGPPIYFYVTSGDGNPWRPLMHSLNTSYEAGQKKLWDRYYEANKSRS